MQSVIMKFSLDSFLINFLNRYCTVPKDHVIDVPENFSMETAGGTPEVFLTALLLLDLGMKKYGIS